MDELIRLTQELVSINSVSATKSKSGGYNENVLAEFIVKFFKKHSIPTQSILLPDGRKCVVVFKKGLSKRTVVLLAHHDTVGIEDYQNKNPFESKIISEAKKQYLTGRGAGDMKSGLAVGMNLMRDLYPQESGVSVIFLTTPDEENNSAGILTAVQYLSSLKDKEKLRYIGVISLDCVLEDLSKRDSKTVILGGTVGKLLPCFYIMGKSAHASNPFEGISSSAIASSIRELVDNNVYYSDKNKITGEFAPPPVCLKMLDLKSEYNTQLPLKTFMYFNYLTFQETPKDVLLKMKRAAKIALKNALSDHRKKHKLFLKANRATLKKTAWDHMVRVFTFEEILRKVYRANSNLSKEIDKIIEQNKLSDLRDLNLRVVEEVVRHAKIEAPFVICFFSPPYYPSSYNGSAGFIKTLRRIITGFKEGDETKFIIKEFAEGVSDLNYLQIDNTAIKDARYYLKNNPLFPKRQEIDLKSISRISMPISFIGPYAENPHGKDEKVEINYSFKVFPKLLRQIISSL